MPQLHLYVSAEIAEALRRKAKAGHTSVSKYLADLVKREVGLGWPDGYEHVLGGWQGSVPNRPNTPAPEESRHDARARF